MSFFRTLFKNIKWTIKTNSMFSSDNNKYSHFCSGSPYSKSNGSEAARDIMVFCHMVEKGLSHNELKPLFGYDRVLKIADSLSNYIRLGGSDPFIVGIAVNTLNKYNEVNYRLGVPSEKLVQIPEVFIMYSDIHVGTIDLEEEAYFSNNNSCFSQLAESRHSVRLYDVRSLPISNDELLECIKIAQCCPSACNRQGVRVKIINNQQDVISKVCDIQGGSKGFGNNAGALLIITTDYRLYESTERRMPMLDCGLFIMNLVYTLYEHKLGSCVLNGSFNKEREEKMKQLVKIPDYEEYAAIIAVSKIPEGSTIKIPISAKRDVEEIVTII